MDHPDVLEVFSHRPLTNFQINPDEPSKRYESDRLMKLWTMNSQDCRPEYPIWSRNDATLRRLIEASNCRSVRRSRSTSTSNLSSEGPTERTTPLTVETSFEDTDISDKGDNLCPAAETGDEVALATVPLPNEPKLRAQSKASGRVMQQHARKNMTTPEKRKGSFHQGKSRILTRQAGVKKGHSMQTRSRRCIQLCELDSNGLSFPYSSRQR